jgi:RNA recognition motif-containing protein
VFVGNLSFQTTKQELTELLSAAGNIGDVYLPSDRETGRPRGFAFVEFSSEAEAAEAIRMFNGREMGGRKLNINAAEDRPRRTGGPRPFSPSGPPGDLNSFGGGGGRPFKKKGSRRGMRARKRSLY